MRRQTLQQQYPHDRAYIGPATFQGFFHLLAVQKKKKNNNNNKYKNLT